MKKKVSEVYTIYQMMNGTKMKTLEKNSAWALIRFGASAKRVAESYESFRENTIESLKPEDWDEKLPLVQSAEDSSSELGDTERAELIAYRDAFVSKVNDILVKEWESEIDVNTDGINEDAIRAYVIENGFDLSQACDLLTFFGV